MEMHRYRFYLQDPQSLVGNKMNRALVGTIPESVKETQSAYQVLILKWSKGGQNTVGLPPPIFNLLFPIIVPD